MCADADWPHGRAVLSAAAFWAVWVPTRWMCLLPVLVLQDVGYLREQFACYGDVSDCQIIVDKHAQPPRGFGFVTFESEQDAEKGVCGVHVVISCWMCSDAPRPPSLSPSAVCLCFFLF